MKLVKGMAEAGEGKYEMIYAGDNMEDKVMAATPREVNRASGSLQLAL